MHMDDTEDGECVECAELLEQLAGYLDGELSPEVQHDLLLHAQECAHCARLVRSLRRLVDYCRLEPNCEMPPAVRTELWITIRRELYSEGDSAQA